MSYDDVEALGGSKSAGEIRFILFLMTSVTLETRSLEKGV